MEKLYIRSLKFAEIIKNFYCKKKKNIIKLLYLINFDWNMKEFIKFKKMLSWQIETISKGHVSSLQRVSFYPLTLIYPMIYILLLVHGEIMSLYARFVTQNLPVCHSSRIHLATVPLVSVPCLRIYDTRVVCVLFSMAGEGTCDAATILFSPLAVLRWLPRKVQPTRPLVTANRFHPWLCASSFTTLTYLTLLLPCLIIINYHPVLLYKI